MGIYSLDLGNLHTRKTGKLMADRKDDFTDNIIFKFYQEIIDLIHRACCRIFNREHRIIRRSFFDRYHCIPERRHMEILLT